MIKNYLKIAYRNLLKYKFISFINLFGLTVGLSCCLLILGYILFEYSYDRYHRHADRIYRVEIGWHDPETRISSLQLGSVAPPYGPLLKNDFQEIEQVTRLLRVGSTAFRYGEKMFNEQNVYAADEYFMQVFDVELLQGNAATALTDPFSVMITDEIARKYFGDEDPLNRVIRMDNQLDLKVTAVFRDFPSNSHVHPSILVSFNTLKHPEVYGEERLRTDWSNNSFFTYLLLAEETSPQQLEAALPAFLNRHRGSEGGAGQPSDYTALTLRALTDIHLHSHKDLELEENGDIKRVYIFSAIALFILLIACINYMNLSTSRSVLRAKEIGVRKVVGAGKKELIFQFLSESVLVAWIATLLAFVICWLAFPGLNRVSGQTLSIDSLLRWDVFLPLLILPFVVGLLSGIYPALFLSSFQPIKVLKGFNKTSGGLAFRQVLVVAQFAISIILLICTAVVYQQLRYMQNTALGYDREQLITFANNAALAPRMEAFYQELLSGGAVESVGWSSLVPTQRLLDAMGSQIRHGDALAPTKADIKYVRVDEHFFNTYNIRLAAGRQFSRDFGADTSAFIINQASVSVLGLKSAEEAIGKDFQYGDRVGKLVGVVHDFHFESLHQRIQPVVFAKPPNTPSDGAFSVKISGHNLPAALAQVEHTWQRFLPEIPFEYNFFDESYARLYQAEQRQGIIFTLFACIAIAIACLGLFGLSAFTISQRLKEIGIRKVLGASTGMLVSLLSKDFLKLVGVAAFIAFPLAWWAMQQWLQDFAYRIAIPLWVFAAAGLLAALVAFLTISFQAVKAARANPVKNLRSE